MNFGFTEEQELLRAEVRKFLDQNCPLDEVRKIASDDAGFSRHLWDRMAELGWVGLTLPEAHGGVGLGWIDLVVILEETGRTLLPSPLIATVLAATAIDTAGTPEQKARWLPGLANGSKIGTLAVLEASDRLDPAGIALAGVKDGDGFTLTGEKRFVLDAGNADLFVVVFRTGADPHDLTLAVVERETSGLSVERHVLMDDTKRAGRLGFDGVPVAAEALLGAPGSAASVFARLLDCGAAAVTAEMVGAAAGAVDLAVEYAKQRIQFGEQIGRFQGVKHPLADMYVDVESFKSLLYFAAWNLDHEPGEVPASVSRAKAYASDAFARIGIDCIQLHGAIGYTWEYDAQLYLKRAKWSRPAFGDSDYHNDRLATLGGL
jgi:alkylation response protein AidB-like acyl-CoA dehydrogenase